MPGARCQLRQPREQPGRLQCNRDRPISVTSTNRVLFKRGNLDPDTHTEGHDADTGKDHHLQPRAGAWTGAPSTLTRSQPCPLLHLGLRPADRGENAFLLFGHQPVLFVWQPRPGGRVHLRLGQLQAQGLLRLSRGQGSHTDLQPGGVGWKGKPHLP